MRSAVDIARDLGSHAPSPCYVLDMRRLAENLARIARVQEEAGVKVLLALKGFALPAAFPAIRKVAPGCAASSLWEAKLAHEFFGGEIHVYAPAYRPDEVGELAAIVDHVVFNTPAQLARFRDAFARQSLGLRVNPGISEVSAEIYNPCRRGSRLGSIPELLEGADLEGLEGLHAHGLCENLHDSSIRLVDALEARFARWLVDAKWVNLGGGHLMTHADYDLDAWIARLREFRKRWDVEVYLEPGGAFVWEAGVLVASVLDIVGTDDVPAAILDVSATAHMPDVLEMPYRPEIVGAGEPGEKPYTYRLGGPTCLAGDEIGAYSFDAPLRPGDRLVFADMAHYTIVKTTMFNGVRHPDIALLHEDGTLEVVRRFRYEDFRSRFV
ncbi:MAG: carboxynorspermidine decarboxylase [Zetaproteobacteria bacterium]|nr:MAG: carboxynorspermidine decarboxylase [Zetaproteobacteria bacterium]